MSPLRCKTEKKRLSRQSQKCKPKSENYVYGDQARCCKKMQESLVNPNGNPYPKADVLRTNERNPRNHSRSNLVVVVVLVIVPGQVATLNIWKAPGFLEVPRFTDTYGKRCNPATPNEEPADRQRVAKL